jgi:hypothetical protein
MYVCNLIYLLILVVICKSTTPVLNIGFTFMYLQIIIKFSYTYIILTLYPRRGSIDISDIKFGRIFV